MEENFSERVLPIYPRMSRLVLARGLTTAAARRARRRAPAAPLHRQLAVWPWANKRINLGFPCSEGWQSSSPVLEE